MILHSLRPDRPAKQLTAWLQRKTSVTIQSNFVTYREGCLTSNERVDCMMAAPTLLHHPMNYIAHSALQEAALRSALHADGPSGLPTHRIFV